MTKVTIVLIVGFFIQAGLVGPSVAQEYTIGPEDELAITFWQQPELNTSVRVSQSGTIVLPVIGNITAAGLTPSELATKIAAKISLFNRNISQASVVVTQYGHRKVYVTGHVLNPGKFTFEVIPDLWKILLEAGGAAETAMLNKVQIIRGSVDAGQTIEVDLTEYLKNGDLSKLPPIYSGDTIHVPGVAAPAPGQAAPATGGVTETQVSDDVVYIYGQVARPGGYRFTQNLNLLDAIVIAGGPVPTAKLNEVKIIIRDHAGTSVATVNLEQYAKNGQPAPFLLRPGDTIFIPEKKPSLVAAIMRQGFFAEALRVVIVVGTSILIGSLLQ